MPIRFGQVNFVSLTLSDLEWPLTSAIPPTYTPLLLPKEFASTQNQEPPVDAIGRGRAIPLITGTLAV